MKKMNRFHLKLIAALTMLMDHIAVLFFEYDSMIYTIFRSIGRISFVLFAYLLAEGFHKTLNRKKFFQRLLIFAALIEGFIVGYYFLSGENMILTFNIFWTLLAGVFGLFLIYHEKSYMKFGLILVVALSEFLGFSYGAYGVLLIVFFGISANKFTNLFHLVFLNLIFIDKPLMIVSGNEGYYKFPVIQWFSLGAIVFIFLYNGTLGKYKWKWFFYVFYPGHLFMLYLISLII